MSWVLSEDIKLTPILPPTRPVLVATISVRYVSTRAINLPLRISREPSDDEEIKVYLDAPK